MDNSPTNLPTVPATVPTIANVLIEPGITIVQDNHSVQLQTFAPANPIITEDLTQSVTIVKDSAEDIQYIHRSNLSVKNQLP